MTVTAILIWEFVITTTPVYSKIMRKQSNGTGSLPIREMPMDKMVWAYVMKTVMGSQPTRRKRSAGMTSQYKTATKNKTRRCQTK